MLGGAFGWPHMLALLAIILLVFGAAKLPALAKSLGQSARVFKGEMSELKKDDAARKADNTASEPDKPETSDGGGATSGDNRTS